MHHRERYLTTNTARLARLCLPRCEIRLRGLGPNTLDLSDLIHEEGKVSLLLFPSEDAHVLSPEYLEKIKMPIKLIVPDGSWRQASKVAKREAELKNIDRVTLPFIKLSEYRLRREPKDEGLATFEAIARSIGIIEGPERGPKIQKLLEDVFRVMVSRTLKSRGTL